MIHVMDLCVVSSRKKTDKSGLKVGETVMVAALKPLPVKKSDPYLQRIYAVVVRVDENGVQIPEATNDYYSYLVDPVALTKLPDVEADKFREVIKGQYE